MREPRRVRIPLYQVVLISFVALATYFTIAGDIRIVRGFTEHLHTIQAGSDHFKEVRNHTSSVIFASENKTASLSEVHSTLEGPKFFLIETPEVTSNLVAKHLSKYYGNAKVNEDSGEIWLHRGMEQLNYEEGRTLDPKEADVFFISAYLYGRGPGFPSDLDSYWDTVIEERLFDKNKPHVVLIVGENPQRSRQAGIHLLVQKLQKAQVNTYSVGYECNPKWQGVDPDHIIPIPYIVRPSLSRQELQKKARSKTRTENFVFYAGNPRRNAVRWAGCNRSMVEPLLGQDNMDVRLLSNNNRLSQDEYNNRMFTSEYCLILCGDTPSSRTLASAMVHGCIPIFIGSRLKGLCEPPCHGGFGWTITGKDNPHLPYGDRIDWEVFPEANESAFAQDPVATLKSLFPTITPKRKSWIQAIMRNVQLGFIYGWNDPVTTTAFGDAPLFIWQSIVSKLHLGRPAE